MEEDEEASRLVFKKLHIMVYDRIGTPYRLREMPSNDGFLVVEETHRDSFLERGDRLLKVQNSFTRGLTYEAVLALMIPNQHTGMEKFSIWKTIFFTKKCIHNLTQNRLLSILRMSQKVFIHDFR